ncbi:MAG TPA: transcription-repair coupling factor [Gemmataceae bacterium]|jgi:transcription-repair coupling factor (superfamily II helicase)|nr:transcription-repair coupling factor [Gemmataceae bacterium]
MPSAATSVTTIENLKDVTRAIQHAQGFHALTAALLNGRGATVDGVWGSSGGLVIAALGLHAPQTMLVVIAHPRDVDPWVEDIASFAGARPVVFPAWDQMAGEDMKVDEIAGQRLRVLTQLVGDNPPRYAVTTMHAIMQPVPQRKELIQGRRSLKKGATEDPDLLAAWLVEQGYRRAEAVEVPGEFSRRGGIIDIFSPDAEAPYRLEFFGDAIDSIRQFAAQTQRSLGDLETINVSTVLSPAVSGIMATGHLCDYLHPDSWTAIVELEDLHEQGKLYLERVADQTGLFAIEGVFQQLVKFANIRLSSLPAPSVEATCHLRVESVERFSGEVGKLRDELDTVASGDRVLIACHNEAERKRLGEVLAAGQLAQSDRLRLAPGRVRAGFRMVEHGLVILSDYELFHREETRRIEPRRRLESRAIDSFLDLAEGDLVVHVSHGIARYRGMQVLEKNGRTEEHLILEFREGTRMYVPASKIDLVQKYVGGSNTDPELSTLGGNSWQKKKDKVQEAVFDLASEMIELHALREAKPGYAFPPDTEWQAEFEAAFPYQETPDQLSSLVEIRQDMQRSRPMDRLICGDVGFGKTELAMRAAFKAIDNGKQVAVLVPTTILAEQHFRTFSQRLAEYPFVVEGISRFRSAGEQKRILKRLSLGGVDVIIGTHRLVSKDAQFKDLGLVIIDEEQRFGVDHKERLKHLRQTVDVLTMTATPIPRTLHMSLLGIRDISNLETPPADRLAIETRIVRFDSQLIRHAILRELNRDGQIYFVHNRVQSIQTVAKQLQSIVPEARIVVGHGQMPEHELEEAMVTFVRREADILVATTIIESGLDIPNANTMFINQADRYGLADLHQLRGRVGRSKHRAYAYLVLDSDRAVSPTAGRRLKAIEEFTELGAGFKIAMRDLEIRGAGNILGTQQSGHIAAVGYEMYCQLMENAVRTLKKESPKTPLEINIDLPWEAYLPRDYVPGQRLRIEVYRRLARIRSLDKLEDFRQEMRDRFGALPEPAEWLLRLNEIRLLAAQWQIAQVHLEELLDKSSGPRDLVLSYRHPGKIQRLVELNKGRVRIVDDAIAFYRLGPKETEGKSLYARLKQVLRLP